MNTLPLPLYGQDYLEQMPSAGIVVAIGPGAWEFSKRQAFVCMVLPDNGEPCDFKRPSYGRAALIHERRRKKRACESVREKCHGRPALPNSAQEEPKTKAADLDGGTAANFMSNIRKGPHECNTEIQSKSSCAACKQCIYDPQAPGGWRQQTHLCSCQSCPLWPVRPLSDSAIPQRLLGEFRILPVDPGLSDPRESPLLHDDTQGGTPAQVRQHLTEIPPLSAKFSGNAGHSGAGCP